MAITFPVALDGFLDGLRIAGATLELGEAIETLTLGGGEVLTAAVGTRLWRGSVTVAVAPWASHEATMARLRMLQRPGASFLFSPPHARQATSPGPTIVDVSTVIEPTTLILSGDWEAEIADALGGRELSLGGLAPGAEIPRGTFLSFTYGAAPTRYALHQVVEGTVADGSGVTPLFEVEPALRAGWSLGAAVHLAVPVLKALMVPGTLRSGTVRRAIADGVAFDWIQTLR